MKPTFNIAVRSLVEHLLRSGDLRHDFFGTTRAVEGIRIHQRVQRQRPASYEAEIPINHSVETDDFMLCISGRIDGIFREGELPTIEEIKSTRRDLDTVQEPEDPVHWGQAQCYAYMWARREGVARLNVQLTYVHAVSGDVREVVRGFDIETLASFFDDLIDRYQRWLSRMVFWSRARDRSIEQAEFPYTTYRRGQREMAVAVYRCIRDGGHLLVQAATGIGKTMGAVFPAVKALGEHQIARIIFLTARTTGRLAAEAALGTLREKGMKIRAVSLTAKDKICFEPHSACLPEECPYAEGFYDRLNAAVAAALEIDALDRDAIEKIAFEHRVCPFEFSLELVSWSDCVIGDYNYAFDPRVSLQRLFQEESGPLTMLVDEAHNLVDRARDMFSAVLDKSLLLALRRRLKQDLPALYRSLGRINAWLAAERRRTRETGGHRHSKDAPLELIERLKTFVRSAEQWLARNIRTDYRDDLLQIYFDCMHFIRVAETYDGRFATLFDVSRDDFLVKLFCMDPSVQLGAAWQQAKAAVLFSATLTPAGYFQDLLGCQRETAKIDLTSPFPPENLTVLAARRISTYYQHREQTCHEVSRLIGHFIDRHQGHYLVFFPSYVYLRMVLDAFAGEFAHIDILSQTPEMSDVHRNDFLQRFERPTSRSLVGFAVMGGVFGEGIDLKGDRLTGAVIVGVGLPGICPERNLIREYYEVRDGSGFAYAYQFPGINRVLQAVGRVIRSNSDRGAVLLIDRRYARPGYRSLLPSDWRIHQIDRPSDVETVLDGFWKG